VKAIITDKNVVIVGLGKTGLSCVRHLSALGKKITIMDSRLKPPGLTELNTQFPQVECLTGAFDRTRLCSADEIILSPGIALANEDIQAAVAAGVRVRGDIDLFAEAANAPVIAITGSNGKSTVTTLVGQMAQCAGLDVGIGGNLGTPALDLLKTERQLYVIELSSFQLETTEMLGAESVVLLNISEDHMDRYPDKMAYLQAKQRIFRGAKKVIVNDDQILSQPLISTSMKLIHFGLESADINKFSVIDDRGELYLSKGFDRLMPISGMKLRGEHNISNALAALALASSVGISMTAMLAALERFSGLSHRCQNIRTLNGVDYVNDSKGTNPGAVVTAINSLGKDAAGKIILIAGGDSKGSDMTPLVGPIANFGKVAVLIGQDAKSIEKVISESTKTESIKTVHAENMAEAVKIAFENAEKGDVVLLSPACASFDMFKNYEQRGDSFEREVARL